DASPVLILIDDAQWLDAASADVIAFAARRTSSRRIRAVVAERWPDRDDEVKIEQAPDDGVSDADAAADLEAGNWRGPVSRGGSPPRAAALALPPLTP